MNRPNRLLESLPAEIRGTSGSGFRQWSTKRKNQFKIALKSLRGLVDGGDVPRLVLAFGVIADFVAPAIPTTLSLLPRGHEWSINADGDMSFRRNGQLLNPAIPDQLPEMNVAKQFVSDLEDGWLDELARSCGLQSSAAFFENW